MNNKKEFVELVQRYETITLKEIKEQWDIALDKNGHDVAQQLTGFGGVTSCTLCQAVDRRCSSCVYGGFYECICHKNTKTYASIGTASTPRQLLNGFRKRAKHMKKTYKELFV